MLEAQQDREQTPTRQVLSFAQVRNRQEQNPQQEPIILKMHVVHDQQHRRPDHQDPDQSPLTRLAFPRQAVQRVEEARIGGDHGDPLEMDHGVGAVVEAAMEVDDDRVDGAGRVGQEELEEGEEGRVIEGPGAGLVGVPAGEREGVGEGEPVAVDLEVGAAVGGDQEELDAGGDGYVPQ